MLLSIIGADGPNRYRLLDKCLNELIESSGCYLFTILCGRIKGEEQRQQSIGQKWAAANGCPVRYITEKTEKDLISRMIFLSDYAVFILDGNPLINNIFMQYKMTGKHGSVIKI